MGCSNKRTPIIGARLFKASLVLGKAAASEREGRRAVRGKLGFGLLAAGSKWAAQAATTLIKVLVQEGSLRPAPCARAAPAAP